MPSRGLGGGRDTRLGISERYDDVCFFAERRPVSIPGCTLQRVGGNLSIATSESRSTIEGKTFPPRICLGWQIHPIETTLGTVGAL